MKAYSQLIKVENALQSVFLLIIRLYCGWQLLTSGFSKLMNVEKVTGFFADLNIPFPYFNAHLVGATELIGGACILVGFASRLITIPVAFTMFVALTTAHHEELLNIFSDTDTFLSQSAFQFFFISLIVMLFGPGVFSVDYLIARDKEKI